MSSILKSDLSLFTAYLDYYRYYNIFLEIREDSSDNQRQFS